MDVGHSSRAGADVVASIGEAGPRLFDLHVKDLLTFAPRATQVDCGVGIMPFPQIFRALKKANFQGCVNLEYEINGNDPLPGMQRSFAYMRGVLAGLAAS
jgi:sugar phosphate isomerase/epimerase